jgi:hypothetical protein
LVEDVNLLIFPGGPDDYLAFVALQHDERRLVEKGASNGDIGIRGTDTSEIAADDVVRNHRGE